MQDSMVGLAVGKARAAVGQGLEGAARWLVENRESDLRELEQGLIERGHALLMGLLGLVLADAPAAESWQERACAECKSKMRSLGRREKWLHTSLGHIRLHRACYYCGRCGRTQAPLDGQLGIDQSGRSPRLVEAMAILGAELPFAQARDRLSKLCVGVEASTSHIEEVAQAVGRCTEQELLAEVEAAWQQPYRERLLPEVESQSPELVISLDRVMVPERGGYHEVRTAAVEGCGLGQQPERWRYVVHTEDVETFGRLVWCEAWRQGLETAGLVVVLGDGAEWIWKLARWHFPGAVQILDLWHVTEHLWAAGRALYGEGDYKVAGWVEQAKQRLLRGQVQELLSEWESLVPQDTQAWERERTYFHNQAPRMCYDEYLRLGLPVGSGAIQSANRHVVGVRVKQAGMRWSRQGVRGVLSLRALLRSGRWNEWWQAHPLPVPLPTAA